MKDEALKLALEALEELVTSLRTIDDIERGERAITAIKQALAAPVQEPVGCEGAIVNGRVYADRLEHDYKFECEAGPLHLCNDWVEFRRCFEWLATHTTPPAAQRQWVGLTDEEMQALWDRYAHMEMMRAIEAKLKEKNT